MSNMHALKPFQRELRRKEAQQAMSTANAFDLKIYIQQLQSRLQHAEQNNKPRRNSRLPEDEDFYNFRDEEEAQANKEVAPAYDFDSELRSVSHRNGDDTFSEESSSPQAVMQAPVVEDEVLKHVTQDLSDMTRQRDDLEEKLTSALANIAVLESSVNKLKIETDSATQTLETERRQMQRENSQLQAALADRKEEAPTNVLAKARDLAEARANAFRSAAEKRATAAELKAKQLAKERDLATAKLRTEKRRVAHWEAARRKRAGLSSSSGDVDDLDTLLAEMDNQRTKLESADYSTLWREDLLKNVDLCLSVLYACETEIVDKRNTFVERSCAAVEATKQFIARRSSIPSVTR